MKPYIPRPISFLRVEQFGGWRIKLYSLRPATSPEIPDQMIESALPVLSTHLHAEKPPLNVAGTDWNHLEDYNVGFAMLHIGSEAVFLLCDYWVGENMLNHTVWISSLEGEPNWQPINASGTSVCVWELAVQSHEREAWIKHVYNPIATPDFDGYLVDTLTTTI